MTRGPDPSDRSVLYLAYEYPVLTQTFTVGEVNGLAREGIRIAVYSCRPARAEDAALAGDSPAVEVRLPPPAASARAIACLARWLARRPLRTLSLLGTVSAGAYRDQPLRCWARGFGQLLWGAALAEELLRRGERPHLHAQFVDAASTVALVAARLLDTTFSVTNHTAYNPYLLVPKLRHARFFVSISEFDRRLTARMARGTGRGRIRVVYQGIDPGAAPSAAEDRRGGRPARILSVAALREKKGHADLLRAAARLRDDGVPFSLTIVGEGPERPRLEALVRQLALGNRVDLAGAEAPARVRERLDRADVFALPCVRAGNGDLDGIPVSLMEAMAAGVPVVSTRISGIPELIADGREGLLAEPGDVAGVAERIRRLLEDPARAGALAARAREKVVRQHDRGTSVRRMAGLFRERRS